MTPAFFDKEHILLRAQLKCLSLQTVKDFDVCMIDPHYLKRKDIIPELAERFGLDIKHVPYTPNTRIAKRFDCSIFNAAFLFSDAEVNARFSCYRFVRPNYVETILSAPPGVNVDFHMLAVGPCAKDGPEKYEKHKEVWDFNGEDVNWDAVPKSSSYGSDGQPLENPENPAASWFPESDLDTDVIPVPMNCYGNIAWIRSKWLEINGTNEVITNASHWEDLDFDSRANRAGHVVVRRTGILYRLFHMYGGFSQRSNVEVDVPLKPSCSGCDRLLGNTHDGEYGSRLEDLMSSGKIDEYESILAWVCKTCLLSGPIYGATGIMPYFEGLAQRGIVRAPTVKDHMIGRNLQALADKMDSEATLQGKVGVFNDSWDNPYYYED